MKNCVVNNDFYCLFNRFESELFQFFEYKNILKNNKFINI